MRALGWIAASTVFVASTTGCSSPSPSVEDAGQESFDAATPMDAAPPSDARSDARADAHTLDASRIDAGRDAARPLPDAGEDAGEDAGPDYDAGEDSGLRGGCYPLFDPVVAPGTDIGGDTYTTYAADFFGLWCTRCHSSTLVTPEERMDAPPAVNLDTEPAVRDLLGAIRYQVGVGVLMPRLPPLPTCEQRLRLVRWIDDGAP